MKKATDWGTWISLLIVVAASIAIAWKLSPSTPVGSAAAQAPAEGSTAGGSGAVRPVASTRPPKATHEPESKDGGAPQSPLMELFANAKQSNAGVDDAGVHPSHWGYRLKEPDRTYNLPPLLEEISDLGTTPDSKGLWAVNDERGTAYRIDIKDGGIAEAIDFGGRGDYESIEEVEGSVIVGRSDGVLFKIDLGRPDAGVATIDTKLGVACNLEGIAWDPMRKKLLLACKSELTKLSRARKSFGIYAMSLETNKVGAEPVIVLPVQAIDDYVGTHPDQPELKHSMGDEFAPSAIAVHPRTGQLYLLSARGSMLVVLEANGTLKRVEGLNPVLHPQPEGISFLPDGTMFISNEARGAHALLHRYDPIKE